MISSCLLGEAVRYDGKDKLNPRITSSILPHIDAISNCPEVASGMQVPRPPIQLTQWEGEVRLTQVNRPSVDWSSAMSKMAHHTLQQFPELCGVISKSKSPSCGVGDTQLYKIDADAANSAEPDQKGSGYFVRICRNQRRYLPIIDEHALNSELQRHQFFLKVFALGRWFSATDGKTSCVRKFINREQLLLACFVEFRNKRHRLPTHADEFPQWLIDLLSGEFSIASLIDSLSELATDSTCSAIEQQRYQCLASQISDRWSGNHAPHAPDFQRWLFTLSTQKETPPLPCNLLIQPYPAQLLDNKA